MQTNSSPPEARWSVEQAATYLGLSKSTLDKTRVYGGGPAYAKLGRRVTYARLDLDAWIASHRRRSTSEIKAEVG